MKIFQNISKYYKILFLMFFVFLFFIASPNFLIINQVKADLTQCGITYNEQIKSCPVVNDIADIECIKRYAQEKSACEEKLLAPPTGLKGASGRLGTIGGIVQPGAKSFEETVGGVIKAALLLVGTIFLMLMVYGGYIWMTARGEEEEAKRAQNIITMAIIGIMVVLAAYAITYFIVYRLTMATM